MRIVISGMKSTPLGRLKKRRNKEKVEKDERRKMKAKYVMMDKGPIIFPDSFSHDEFVSPHIKSAGQVMINGDEVAVFGESMSLNLKPKDGDAALIKLAFEIR
jgi:hypothetical protein